MKELLLILVPLVAAVVGGALAARPHAARGSCRRPGWRMRCWRLGCCCVRPTEPRSTRGSGCDPLARAMLPAVSLLFLGVRGLRRALPAIARRAAEPRVRGEFPRGAGTDERGAHGAASGRAVDRDRGGDACRAVPLLHFNNTPRAFEATWKYLLVGGTGIALSLLGLVLPGLRLAARRRGGGPDVRGADGAGRRRCRGRGC